MIFKRGVFESRRRNKNIFRPKIRINLKEAQTVSLRTSSLFQTPSAVCFSWTSVVFKAAHSILNSAPHSLHQWQVEECLPNLDAALLHPFLKALDLCTIPVSLKGKRLKKSLAKVQTHRPVGGDAAEAFVSDASCWL